jgi:hypothetical protein
LNVATGAGPKSWRRSTCLNLKAVAPGFLVEFATAIEVIEEIERKVRKPAVTSNRGMFWHCLRRAGIDDRIPNFGRLFREFYALRLEAGSGSLGAPSPMGKPIASPSNLA